MLGTEKSQKLLGKSILTGDNPQELLGEIIPGGKLDKEKALEVYRNDYVSRMSSVMGENFEGTWSLLGDEIFFSLCREYIKEYNSTSPDIGDFGKHLDVFLKDHPLGVEYPFLPELSHLDMQFMRIFHLPIEKPVDIEKLKTHENLSLAKFKFVKALHLQKSKFPIYKIWDLKNLSDTDRENVDLDFSSSENICLYKSIEGIKVRFLNPLQVDVLEKLHHGLNLDSALENSEMDPQSVQELFEFISTSGVLVDVI